MIEIADVSTETFVRVMVTNALSPMRVVEILQDLLVDDPALGLDAGEARKHEGLVGIAGQHFLEIRFGDHDIVDLG